MSLFCVGGVSPNILGGDKRLKITYKEAEEPAVIRKPLSLSLFTGW